MLLGLGSIVGTGVFVSIGIAAGVAGSAVVAAVLLAGLVAAANGLSSAQLAAAHPVSGGTYEYASRYLSPSWGLVAGWLFLAAKSASAATAALGFAGYVSVAFGSDDAPLVLIGVTAVLGVGGVVIAGLRRSSAMNAVVVAIALVSLVSFVVVGAGHIEGTNLSLAGSTDVVSFFEATALMFVAYTGYGRIATLGEEVRDPARIIPRAIVITMVVTIVLYGSVALVGVGVAGAGALADATEGTAAPLATVALAFGASTVARMLEIGAVAAMLGVLLNLILGLSRIVLAMGRRRDIPGVFASVNRSGTTPLPATVLVIVGIASLTLIGDVRTTWTFSAVTVLGYYALTNAAALRLPPEDRRFPRVVAWSGLVACLSLALFIDVGAWAAGVTVVAVGFGVRWLMSTVPGPDE